MYKRKSYLIFLICSLILMIISNLFILRKNSELTEYWGSDYIAEIYQHSYSLDKFFIQLMNVSGYFFLCSLILLIFNFKSIKIVKGIVVVFVFLILLSFISLNYKPTDNRLDAIGSFDLGKRK